MKTYKYGFLFLLLLVMSTFVFINKVKADEDDSPSKQMEEAFKSEIFPIEIIYPTEGYPYAICKWPNGDKDPLPSMAIDDPRVNDDCETTLTPEQQRTVDGLRTQDETS